MQFIDTHCHIHEQEYPLDSEDVYQKALRYGVSNLICVGTNEISSEEAVAFVASRQHCVASIGLHPHDAAHGEGGIEVLKQLVTQPKVVAIGECGLDYFYNNSPREQQFEMLHAQFELAKANNLPMIFHVREAFDDFWPIFDQYPDVRGVLHSFTDSLENLDKALERGLFIGVNGISTFTKSDEQQRMFGQIPLQKLLLETDAPFLTPVPKRGTVNEPAFVTLIAEKQADLRSISLEELSAATSANATRLFNL